MEPDGLVAHHVTLTVGDLGASSAWYQRVLGVEVVAEREGAGWRRVLLKRSAGLMIGLTEHEGTVVDDTFHEARVGLDHVSFACADLEALEAWRERFEALGVTHSPVAETPIAHVLVFRDPDGIQLEFFAPKGTEGGRLRGGSAGALVVAPALRLGLSPVVRAATTRCPRRRRTRSASRPGAATGRPT